jgi:acyl-CoA synthetase (AMP-forming)/AMP-acid ligase II/acyl carrier protein
MLRERASTHASQVAMKFLLDGERQETSIVYAELDRRARAVASLIQSRCEPGDRVLLLYAPGPDFVTAFFACLYAGVTAVPAYPPDPGRLDRTLPRLCSMAADAEPAALLTTSDIESLRDFLIPEAAELGRLPWIVTDVAPAGAEDHWRDPCSGPDDLAFLQYTSGSTGTPKGVMLSHGNLLHNSAAIAMAFRLAGDPLGVIWLPPYHDMGLIGGILQPVYAGFPVVLLSPVHMLQRPLRWLEAISQYRATVSGGPNFAFDLCVRKSTEEQRAALDLSSWRLAFNGAEPVRPQTLRRFAEAFRVAGFDPDAFYPCYGLAEATLLVSGAQVRRPALSRPFDRGSMLRGTAEPAAPVRSAYTGAAPETEGTPSELVSAGQPCLGTQVEIRDPGSGGRLPEGRVGEIWVHGPGVSAGYWRRPALSAETFPVDRSGRRWLRTGDLGTQVEGELFITGRAKDLIVLHGRNHYPQDIEVTAEASSSTLRPGAGAAFGVDNGAGEELVLVQEVVAGRERSAAELRSAADAVRSAVALAHGTPLTRLVLIKPGTIPKTSSGKIQRAATRDLLLAGELQVLAAYPERALPAGSPRDPHARIPAETVPAETVPAETVPAETVPARKPALSTLRSVLAAALGCAAEDLDAGRSVVSYGVDSVMAVETAHRLEQELGAAPPLTALLGGGTLREIAAELDAMLAEAPGTETGGTDALAREYPASIGQRALTFLDALGDSPRYHVAWAARSLTPFDVPRLRRSVADLVARHGSLRTGFEDRPDGLTAVLRDLDCDFAEVNAAGLDPGQLADLVSGHAEAPFDLAGGRVFRARLFHHADGDVLLLAAHHIAVDFWSLVTVTEELRVGYAGTGQGPERPDDIAAPSMSRHAARQQRYLAGDRALADRDYWHELLRDPAPVLPLAPGNGAGRPGTAGNAATVSTAETAGAKRHFTLPAALSRQLHAAARAGHTTPFTVLTAAYGLLLSGETGVRDLVVATPVAGRPVAALRDVVGYCVNTVLLRTQVPLDHDAVSYMRQVGSAVLAGLDHGEYPYPLLVEELRRQAGTPATVKTMVVFERPHSDARPLPPGLALGLPGMSGEFGGIRLESYPLRPAPPPFDLVLVLAEDGTDLVGSWHYDPSSVAPSTVAQLADRYPQVLAETVDALLAAGPGRP